MSSTKFSLPRGTQDVLPSAWSVRTHILDIARARFESAGFGRISTPTFEHSELFHRGVGESSDIVSKETYTFEDRGGRSLTLRPEGTAGVARAFVNHGLHREPLPAKLWYVSNMFRYEKPQAGRLREHSQIGCELFGSDSPAADVEVISVQAGIYRDLGLPNLQLHINSIGSGASRAAYRTALVSYFEPLSGELDDDSRARLATNPLRILDSKHPRTAELVAEAPKLTEYLTTDDRARINAICELLTAVEIEYVIDPTLVRGLDYYTSTVWEFSSNALGAQSAVGAGGRYDALVEQFGGSAMPAVGFGSGLERIELCLAAMGESEERATADVYVGVRPGAGTGAWATALRLTSALRDLGRAVEVDLAGRSEKGQAKQASRLDTVVRVLVDDLGARMFLRGDYEGVDLPTDASSATGQIDAQLLAQDS
jgi:histidyl-tRNA synthetase